MDAAIQRNICANIVSAVILTAPGKKRSEYENCQSYRCNYWLPLATLWLFCFVLEKFSIFVIPRWKLSSPAFIGYKFLWEVSLSDFIWSGFCRICICFFSFFGVRDNHSLSGLHRLKPAFSIVISFMAKRTLWTEERLALGDASNYRCYGSVDLYFNALSSPTSHTRMEYPLLHYTLLRAWSVFEIPLRVVVTMLIVPQLNESSNYGG